MVLAIVGGPIAVLILTIDVLGLTFYLKWASRPYSRAWRMRFAHGAATLREGCYLLFLCLAGIAFLLMFPMLLGWGNHHTMALVGSVDLLSSIVLYGLWKWIGWLIRHVVLPGA